MSRTKPGSVSHTYYCIIEEESERLGRGITIAELRDFYRERVGEPPPDSLTSVIGSMKRRGVLEIVGGRPGHSLYALAGSSHLHGNPKKDEPGYIILQAVLSAFERLERPVPKREIRRELRRAGHDDLVDGDRHLRKYLETLARRTERGHPSSRAPKLERVYDEPFVGDPAVYWVPADHDLAEAPRFTPRSRAEAVRRAIFRCQQVLGRPVSVPELRRWLQWGKADPLVIEMIDENRVGTAVTDVASPDSEHPGEEGRVHAVETEHTCHGGPASRYTVGPPSDRDVALCNFLDALEVFRVRDELESISALRQQAELTGSSALASLAVLRRQALGRLLVDHAAPLTVEVATEAVRDSIDQCWAWMEDDAIPVNERSGWRRHLTAMLDDLESSTTLAGPSEQKETPSPATVGHTATTTPDDLELLLDHTVEALQLEVRRDQLLSDSRRVGATSPGRERIGRTGEAPLSHLDRPDALQEIVERFPVPKATTLVANARDTLGHVLRDEQLLMRHLADTGPAEAAARRRLVVALGLLGQSVEPERAIPDRSDYEDTAAWILGTVLADWEGASDRVSEVDSAAEGMARRLTDKALSRLRSGSYLTVVG